jgi:hypothetical protein
MINKRVWKLPTSTQLRATWHTDSLYMVVLPFTGTSRYHNCFKDGGISSEYFGYHLAYLYVCSPLRVGSLSLRISVTWKTFIFVRNYYEICKKVTRKIQKSKALWDFSFSDWAVQVSKDASARIQKPVASCSTYWATWATYIYIHTLIYTYI